MAASRTCSWSATSRGATCVLGLPDYPLPTIDDVIDMTVRLGRRTNPAIRCAGVSLNTSRLDESAARQLLADETHRLKLPAADPMRGGVEFDGLVDACSERLTLFD